MIREKNVLPRVKGALIWLQFNCIALRFYFTYVGSKLVEITGTSTHNIYITHSFINNIKTVYRLRQ